MYSLNDFGNHLGDSLFNNLLPINLKDDPKYKALSIILDRLYKEIYERLDGYLIYSKIDTLDEPTLNDLAWQFNLGFHDGWNLAGDIDEKRELIKNAISLHHHKGTRYSVERIGEIINMPISIFEWWEIKDLKLKPGEFLISVDMSAKGEYKGMKNDIIKLVNGLKNVRSRLHSILQTTNAHQTFFAGGLAGIVAIKTITSDYFNIPMTPVTLLFEQFASPQFPPTGWTLGPNNSPWGLNWDRGTLAEYSKSYPGCAGSNSYANNQPVPPDNWLITPAFTLPSTPGHNFQLDFWVRAGQDDGYRREHYSVYIGNTPQPNTTNFSTTLHSETLNDTNGRAYRLISVKLSEHTGKKYIAFRHHDCSDQLWLAIDDIKIHNDNGDNI